MSLENPQLEDGFTPIANAIMDALARTRFSGYERSVLDFLFRKTYGWSKKSDLIALSQFVDGTGILKPHIVRTIKRLMEKNVIHKTVAKIGNDNLVRYEFNKHWGEWTVLPKLVTAPPSLPKMVIQPLPKMVPTISISTTTPKVLKGFVVANKIDDDPVVQLYRTICVPAGLPNILVLTPFRVRAIKRITKEYGLERLEVLFRKAITSKFLLGDAPSKSHSGWRADFDFFLRAETLVYINEGSRYFDAPLESGPLLSVPIWTPEQDAEHKREAREWLEDDKAKEDAR